jgi:hypothetical protein
MSICVQSLFAELVWLYANWMLDTKRVGSLVVEEFKSAIVTIPLWGPPYFEGEAFLIVEVVAVLEDVSDAEL